MSLPLVFLADEAATRATLASACHRRGMNVMLFGDGDALVQALKFAAPDAVVLDLVLPRLNGHKVIQALREHKECKAVPVLITTAVADPRLRQTVENLGIQGFFLKPVDHALVAMEVSRLLQSRPAELRFPGASS